jgi:hypothetical protein
MRCPYGRCVWEIEHRRGVYASETRVFWHGHDALFLGNDLAPEDVADRVHRFVRDSEHADPFTMPEHTLDQPACRN